MKVKTVLISVSDKEGLVSFAKGLEALGIEIMSTGGTCKTLKKAGIKAVEVSDYTAFPEMMDGRVKTLHPKVHGGILALRGNEEHIKQAKNHGIKLIDLVVVNLYPFEKEPSIENIDIGGPAMIRSAAKNFESVCVVVNPGRYGEVLEELKKNRGEISEKMRETLAAEAFKRTCRYDAAISAWMGGTFTLGPLEKIQELRYGENPHQKAAFYGEEDGTGIAGAKQLHGKGMSYNNVVDADSCVGLLREFEGETACAILKHNSPCGAAVGKSVLDAYEKALECDPVSAFGGIVGFNQKVDEKAAKEITKSFKEIVLAPSFTRDALQELKKKKNLIILEVSWKFEKQLDMEKVDGGLVVQDKDAVLLVGDFKVATKRKPSKKEMNALMFAWKVVKWVKSNAIVYARDGKTAGIGAGQMSRVDAAKIAAMKARSPLKGCVMASDAFFPFKDAVDEAAKRGITAVIQPGGSIRDEEVTKACDEHGIAMVLTGTRHFRH
jgi:phosphoribosylaminoimidazolecarboxamide formyltransferase/IMP cyclohydrolase